MNSESDANSSTRTAPEAQKKRAGGIDRSRHPSHLPKLGFFLLHMCSVLLCVWVVYGGATESVAGWIGHSWARRRYSMPPLRHSPILASAQCSRASSCIIYYCTRYRGAVCARSRRPEITQKSPRTRVLGNARPRRSGGLRFGSRRTPPGGCRSVLASPFRDPLLPACPQGRVE